MKKALTILCLLVAGMANAQHLHTWQKVGTSSGVDQMGQQVTICHWVCRSDWNAAHYATTQGHSGMCSWPMY